MLELRRVVREDGIISINFVCRDRLVQESRRKVLKRVRKMRRKISRVYELVFRVMRD
jgi:hypothetical protein